MSISHVYSKSIAGFYIYRQSQDFERMRQIIIYYQYNKKTMPYSGFRRIPMVEKLGFDQAIALMEKERGWVKRIELIDYCLMNTHFHLIVNEINPYTLSSYMADILNSYTRAFNLLHKRKGPLWQSRFGRSSIVGEDGLEKVKNYLYQNPVEAGLVTKPEQWPYSSYASHTNLVG